MDRPAPAAGTLRAVRTYLTALLPSAEVDDAMHEVVDDVAYWGDRDLDAVLRVAHAVVVQRGRVSDEAAAQALVNEVGLDDDEAVARILSIEPSTARRLREGVAVKLGAPAPRDQPVREAAAVEAVVEEAPPQEPVDASEPAGTEPLRIGFDEDVSVPDSFTEPARSSGRSLLFVFAVGWVIIAIVLLVLQD